MIFLVATFMIVGCLLHGYHTETLTLGSATVPVGATFDFDALLASKLQTYIENVIDTKLEHAMSKVLEGSASSIMSNVTATVMKRVQENAQINVIFHAVRSSPIHYGYKEVIVFDSVERNVGNGYNKLSGKFTAPYNGFYLFTTRVTTTQGNHMHIALVKNGDITSISWAVDDTAIITETLVLNQGDKVWIWHNINAQENVYPTYTIFGGSLVRLM